MSLIIPPKLNPGDKIAILSPASKIDPRLIDDAEAALATVGLQPVVMPHAKGVHGSFSGSVQQRLSDFTEALSNLEIKAILCSRGGYGAVHLLEYLNELPAAWFNKWLIGFSDITALHALWQRKGYCSLHAAMAKHIGMSEGFPYFERQLDFFSNVFQHDDSATPSAAYSFSSNPLNVSGKATGRLVGGNLAVLGGLIGTPFDPTAAQGACGNILLIEDIAEPIYKVERIMWQLRLKGVFSNLKGLIVGQFTEYKPSADYPDMYVMIADFTRGMNIPIAFGLPFGHIEANCPILLGCETDLHITPYGVELTSFM